MGDFNAAKSRAKRPFPLWVDAFQRDTQHLEADEIGAYLLVLMAMWSRETCDLPDDDRRLAKICRVSTRLWKSRIGPVVREFLTGDGDAVYSLRLREEAEYVEGQLQKQSDRKRQALHQPGRGDHSDGQIDENSRKILKINKSSKSTEQPVVPSVEGTAEHPSPQPDNRNQNRERMIAPAHARTGEGSRDGGCPPVVSSGGIGMAADESWIRQEGAGWLLSRGYSETQVPRFIEDWLSAYPPAQIRGAIGQARVIMAASPVAYIAKVLANGARPKSHNPPFGNREQARRDAEQREMENIRRARALSRGEEVNDANDANDAK